MNIMFYYKLIMLMVMNMFIHTICILFKKSSIYDIVTLYIDDIFKRYIYDIVTLYSELSTFWMYCFL
jgi:hypothetical protein